MTRDEKVKARLEHWRRDPIAFVREEFQVEPDPWQAEALAAFPNVNRLAVKSCKGPGKTALLAWCVSNFLATRPHPRIGCVSITGGNLSSNLWPELAKWMNRSPFMRNTFSWSKTEITHKLYPGTWWAQARSWARQADAERQADALAGLHEDFAMAVLDESGGIPQAVMATAEAVLATGLETKVLQAGNPTHTTGPLHRACTIDRALWKLINITGDPDDPNRSTRIDVEWARQQIHSYGRDNPWVKVNVLGEFPDASINALLGVEEVQRAMQRHYKDDAFIWAQKRIGIDVARFGDDRTVLFPRQGLVAFKPVVMRTQNTVQIAARAARGITAWGAELTFVDDTGHWGHGVIDNLTTAGFPAIGIVLSDPAIDPRFRNRRAEMYMAAAEWVRQGGALPMIDELVPELTEPTYSFIGGRFVLEEKDQIKKRLGSSPDLADALVLTFAMVDMPGEMAAKLGKPAVALHDADPFEHVQVAAETVALRDADPYSKL